MKKPQKRSSARLLAKEKRNMQKDKIQFDNSHEPFRKLRSRIDYEHFRDHPHNCVNHFTTRLELMPEWVRNQGSFIRRGYRRLTNSWRGCLNSLTYVHNETGNVYTHLFGVLMIIPMASGIFSILDTIPTVSQTDYIMSSIYMIGIFSCLASSSAFHLCACHSEKVSKGMNKLDYVGIVGIQMGSFIPGFYYAFYCDPFYQVLYMSCIFLLGLATIYGTVGPHFEDAEHRWIRTTLFFFNAVGGVLPAFHHIFRYGTSMAVESLAFYDILYVLAFYVVGAFFFVSRFPERSFPGTFDIIGHSHQIWHIFVLAGAFWYFNIIHKQTLFVHTHNPTCSISDHHLISMFN